jgi:GDP-mannose transporter
MTVTNKYVLSGYDFNMNFLLLTIQVRQWWSNTKKKKKKERW